MVTSCKKALTEYTSEINAQVIDLVIEQSEQIFILEKENLELKWETGY